MAIHGVVRTDNMHGTAFGGDLVSVLYQASSANADVDNGCFCVPGAYKTGEREVRLATAPAANTAVSALALIASEEVDSDKKYNTLAEFYNKAGSVARGYKLHPGDMFSLTKEALSIGSSVTPTVGTSILECQADAKGLLVNSATSGSTKIADLVAIEGDWLVFRVVD